MIYAVVVHHNTISKLIQIHDSVYNFGKMYIILWNWLQISNEIKTSENTRYNAIKMYLYKNVYMSGLEVHSPH